MKKTSLIVSVALTQMLMADSMSDKTSNQSGSMMMQDSGVMNTSARPMIQGNDVYMFADAIFWQAQQVGTDWARTSAPGGSSNGQSVTNITEQSTTFNWNWGFRAGIGYDMDYDQWDTKLYYTWLHASKKENAAVVQGAAVSSVRQVLVYDDQGSVANASANWTIHYSVFDWDLGRAYMISKNFSVRPNIGIKGGWIHQQLTTDSTTFAGTISGHVGPVAQSSRQKNNTWFVGPSFGLDTKWNLGNMDDHYFSLFGDMQGALMYGHTTTTYTQSGVVNGIFQFPSNRNINMVLPMLKAMMGFGWDVNFNNDACHFGLKLGYELQYWFDLNHYFQYSMANQTGSLAFQGGTLDIRFDF